MKTIWRVLFLLLVLLFALPFSFLSFSSLSFSSLPFSFLPAEAAAAEAQQENQQEAPQTEQAQPAEQHEHCYVDGICTVCGVECPHTGYLNGVCMTCGMPCTHGDWTEDGVCVKCWYQCPHAEHTVSGVCALCGKDCQHILHNINGECLVCRQKTGHTYEHGRCTVCGKKIEFTENFIDADLLRDSGTEAGTVQSVTYTTFDYTLPEEKRVPIEKRFEMYLPYGYDSGRKYDVLFLCAGQNTDETYWFSGKKLRYYIAGDDTSCAVPVNILLDNMIRRGLCDPLIVVSVTQYRNGIYSPMDHEEDPVQFAEEFRRDILPAVVSRASTRAEDGSEEALSEARDHFGFYGASYGAFIVSDAILRLDADLVSWYGCVSGFSDSVQKIYETMKDCGTQDLRINYLYTSSGELEDSEITVRKFYQELLETIPGVSGEDSAYLVIPGARHEGRVWVNGLYNCLQIFFGGPGKAAR